MNAVSRDYDNAKPYEDSYARLDGRSRSGLEGEMQRWGKYWEELAPFEGHATASSLAAFLEGFGGVTPSSRELAKDMPEGVQRTHLRFLTLCDNDREVLWNHYVAAVNPETNRCPTEQEKAWLLGLSYATWRKRLSRARCRMLGIREEDILALEPPARELSEAEGDAALVDLRASRKNEEHGVCAKLARKYGVSWSSMSAALAAAAKRAESREKAKAIS